MIDEIPEPFYKHAAQPNVLETKREESDEWLDVDLANRFLAQNLRRSQDRFLELLQRKSCREWGRIYVYPEDFDHCALAILGVVLQQTQQVGQPYISISLGHQSLKQGVWFEYSHKVV